jgi:hypothetical protein
MSKSFERQKQYKKDLAEIWKHPENACVIHYSCESFYDRPDGSSPRITSIAVRNLHNAQTRSFSIHKYGELKGYSPQDMNVHYNELEKEMISAFFEFAKERKDYKWVHWNMRDENFGFHAIELRFKVLGGEPFVISDERKFDLSRILIGIYGKGYIGHPRLESLMKHNKISNLGFKTGKEEAELFENGNYVGLHQSTLAKCDVFANFCQLAFENDLKTFATWREVHGHSLKAFLDWLQNHTYIAFLLLLISVIANIIQITKG